MTSRPAVPIAARRTVSCTGVIVAAAVSVLTISCSEPAAPPPPFALSLSVAQVYAAELFDLPDGPAISCGVDFEAAVTGSGVAVWQGATFYWFAGGDRTEAIDSLRVGPITTRNSWTADSISAVDSKLAGWTFSGRAPFDAEAHFRYRVVGEQDTQGSFVRFSCGPKLPLGGIAAPSLVADPLSVVDEVEPGDTIHVTYSAQSPFGLWTSGIFVEAWDAELRFSDRMAFDANRTVELVVPRGALLNVPFGIKAFAEDGGLQTTILDVPAVLRVVDRHPPVITESGPLAAEYRVGDRIEIRVEAEDNNQLGWLVYMVGAPANVVDSLRSAAAVPSAGWGVPLLVQPGWIGMPSVTVFVRDMAGLSSDTVDLAPGGVSIVAAP